MLICTSAVALTFSMQDKFLSSADFFFKINLSKKSLRNSIRLSNSLDTDQDYSVTGSDLDPNCLQRHQQATLVWKDLNINT